jgi:hypothetical protein
MSFANELCDVSASRAVELGFDVPGGVVSEARSDDTLFAQVTDNAFVGRPALERAGARVWFMGHALGLRMPRLDRAGMMALRRFVRMDALECGLLTGGVELCQRVAVFELLVGSETRLWRMGRRASLLAYALNRGVIIREALECFEKIGELWGLRARNKRSAVCEAMNVLRAELVRFGRLPEGFRFWFEKEAGARLVYAEVQRGNQNRGSGISNLEQGTPNDEGDEEWRGVPVREEWRGLSTAERKRRLDALWKAHAWVPDGEDRNDGSDVSDE